MPTLLVVDDEPSVTYSFRRVFEADGVTVHTAATAAAGLAVVREHRPDVAVLDLQLPDRDGLALFADVRAAAPKTPVVFLTAHGTAETAIEAMKRGAFDYLTKPVDLDRLTQVVGRAFEAARLMQSPPGLGTGGARDRLIGRSQAMQDVFKQIGRVAPQDVPVLILGESGVGKELVARAVYGHSRRADRPFLAVNCAAIPEGLLESELFGHEKGAFTGAERRRIGKFEQADGGTLFLDEVGDLPPAAQAKMLRVIQDQQFERVGGSEPVRTQVRLVAATNADLERRIADGRFRADLYYRLRGVPIHVPPLRDRADDVPELAHHFLFAFNAELGLHYQGFDPEALACLRQHRWPGNVRELQGVVREAMIRAAGPLVQVESLPAALRGGPTAAPVARPSDPLDVPALVERLLRAGENGVYGRVVEEVERYLIARVLRETKGNQSQASDRLGLNRSTLRYKLRELGLGVERSGGVTGDEADERPTGA